MADTDWTNEELASIDRIPRYNPLDPANGGDAYSFGGDGYLDNQMRQTVDALIVARGARRMALSASSAAILAAQEAASAKAERMAAQNAATNAYNSAQDAAQSEGNALTYRNQARDAVASVSLPAIGAANALQFLQVKPDGSGYQAAAVDLSSAIDMPRVGRTANTVLAKADKGKWIDITSGTFTQTFGAAATLGNGWKLIYANSGTGDITVDPNGSETIDGLASFIMYPGEVRLVLCDGTQFRSFVITPFLKQFLSSANFLPPPGYKSFEGLARDGGGSGAAGQAATGSGNYGNQRLGGAGGVGGAGGAVRLLRALARVLSTSVAVTVGSGGQGGAATVSAPGGNSGISEFFTVSTLSAAKYVSSPGGTGGYGGSGAAPNMSGQVETTPGNGIPGEGASDGVSPGTSGSGGKGGTPSRDTATLGTVGLPGLSATLRGAGGGGGGGGGGRYMTGDDISTSTRFASGTTPGGNGGSGMAGEVIIWGVI